ncbi:hypothetical protein [Cerasicoccus frondis]|uniref:hypothetical protein n=1 Tax=Cerasicoccus frondis TaxID=490090 RepID=UPI002852BBDE|nr:hypothetical protein [Cerasicoccus frondis]
MSKDTDWVILTPENKRLRGGSLEALCRDHREVFAAHDSHGGKIPVEIRAARQLSKRELWNGFRVDQRGTAGRKQNGHRIPPDSVISDEEMADFRDAAPLLQLAAIAREIGMAPTTLSYKSRVPTGSLTNAQAAAIRKTLKPLRRFLDSGPSGA